MKAKIDHYRYIIVEFFFRYKEGVGRLLLAARQQSELILQAVYLFRITSLLENIKVKNLFKLNISNPFYR
jgi:hypothetical protein